MSSFFSEEEARNIVDGVLSSYEIPETKKPVLLREVLAVPAGASPEKARREAAARLTWAVQTKDGAYFPAR